MNKLNFKSFLQLLAIGCVISLVTISCGDDDITGCTDPEATNYNANATISSGDCVYPRDNFLGSYVGDISCAGLTGGIVPDTTITFTITEHIDPNVLDSVNINIQNVDILNFPIGAGIDGDKLIITEAVRDVPAEIVGPVDLFITGEATVINDEMNGLLIVKANSSATGGTIVDGDQCTLTGTKQ